MLGVDSGRQTESSVSLNGRMALGGMTVLPWRVLVAVKLVAFCVLAMFAVGAVSAASASAAGGTVVAWGSAERYGELGNGVKSQTDATPVFVCATGETAPCKNDLGNVSGISAGEHDGMALLENASVMAWGQNIGNILGQGEGNTLGGYSDVPVAVCAQGEKAPCGFDLKGVKQVSVGESSALALLEDGEVLAWGGNEYGQLGNGKHGNEQDAAPEPVCAVNETVPCTHYLTGVREIAAGDRYAMALLNDGEVVAWGSGGEGAIGRGNDDGYYLGSDVPAPVCAAYEPETKLPCLASKQNVLTGVKKIAAAINAPIAHSFAVLKSGEVVGWGANASGQLGNGTTTESFVPVPVKELTEVTAIAAYNENSMALLADGNVKAWGNNEEGQLGNGTKTESTAPTEVPGLANVTAISGGYHYSLALLSNETVEAWGEDEYGELGNGGHTPAERSEVPIPVCAAGEKENPCKHALQHVTAIAGMGYAAIALLAAKPEVSTQPNSATAAADESVSFTAEASGNPKPTVQWFVSKNAGKFEEVAGATSDTLTIASAKLNESGNVYYAVFTNDQGTATSASATLTLLNSPPVFTAASPPLTAAAGAKFE